MQGMLMVARAVRENRVDAAPLDPGYGFQKAFRLLLAVVHQRIEVGSEIEFFQQKSYYQRQRKF